MGAVERGKRVMGIEEGTCWDEHWVLYGNRFDNKFHIKKNAKVLEEFVDTRPGALNAGRASPLSPAIPLFLLHLLYIQALPAIWQLCLWTVSDLVSASRWP